jgi:hypothetical protein
MVWSHPIYLPNRTDSTHYDLSCPRHIRLLKKTSLKGFARFFPERTTCPAHRGAFFAYLPVLTYGFFRLTG